MRGNATKEIKVRNKFTEETKVETVRRYLHGEGAVALAIELGTADSVIYAWVRKYKANLVDTAAKIVSHAKANNVPAGACLRAIKDKEQYALKEDQANLRREIVNLNNKLGIYKLHNLAAEGAISKLMQENKKLFARNEKLEKKVKKLKKKVIA